MRVAVCTRQLEVAHFHALHMEHVVRCHFKPDTTVACNAHQLSVISTLKAAFTVCEGISSLEEHYARAYCPFETNRVCVLGRLVLAHALQVHIVAVAVDKVSHNHSNRL